MHSSVHGSIACPSAVGESAVLGASSHDGNASGTDGTRE